MSTVRQHFGTRKPICAGTTPIFDVCLPEKLKESIRYVPCGIEVEVENCSFPNNVGMTYNNHWILEKDGSLRNEGREFISRLGMMVGQAPEALDDLFAYFQEVRDTMKKLSRFHFSERTSIHIHLDVGSFDEQSISNLLVLYTLYEDQLFKYCHPRRRENVFCIPLRNSNVMNDGGGYSNVWDIVGSFSKYSAINLEACRRYGTVEFRHLQGTDDKRTIMNWLVLLSLLRRYAEHADPDKLKEQVFLLKSESAYEVLTNDIFSTYSYLILQNTCPLTMDTAVSDAKTFFIED